MLRDTSNENVGERTGDRFDDLESCEPKIMINLVVAIANVSIQELLLPCGIHGCISPWARTIQPGR